MIRYSKADVQIANLRQQATYDSGYTCSYAQGISFPVDAQSYPDSTFLCPELFGKSQ